MMKLSHFRLLLIAPSLLLTSCGYGLKEVYSGIPYNSTDFTENYFNVWDKRINPNAEGNKITVTKNIKELDKEKDNVFTSLKDNEFKNIDDNWTKYCYGYDLERDEDLIPEGQVAYGPTVAMTKLDDSFKYGIVSKMFDGQMFCNGDFQKSRTQVEPTNKDSSKGLGVLFSKESNDAKYIMMNFKCAVVKSDGSLLKSGLSSDIKLNIGLYYRNDTGYTYAPFTYEISGVPTNSGDGHGDSRFLSYVCFGFSLENYDKERLIGYSIQYEKLSDNSGEPDSDTLHALMLYEVSFPYTTWH